jgi:hypothetical protein
MKVRYVALAVLLLAGFALSAAAQKDKDDKPKDKVYKTPKEVFDAFIEAMNKRDARTFVGCLAPEPLTQMVGFYAVQGLQKRDLATSGTKDGDKDNKLAKRWKPTFDVLDKHGLTVKATKDVKVSTTEEREKARKTILPLIKDKSAFLVDYQEALDKDRPKVKEEDFKAKLAELKIDGDKATAVLVVLLNVKDKKDKTKESEQKDPVEFVKVGGGWKINPSPKKKKDEPKDK